MPLYMVNVLSCKDFDRIYNIHEICYIRVSTEHFQNLTNPKQCYRCQRIGHARKIFNFTPKCLKCAGPHLSQNCNTKVE